ncbi:hypothetical protein ACH5RR_023368 [Cinchona calisaya]|uniref:Uncharacterized protein n=1 Tax=Cinchona calisaya TaxID=153742 RepID=A0ABD2ZAG0_9GENT
MVPKIIQSSTDGDVAAIGSSSLKASDNGMVPACISLFSMATSVVVASRLDGEDVPLAGVILSNGEGADMVGAFLPVAVPSCDGEKIPTSNGTTNADSGEYYQCRVILHDPCIHTDMEILP